MTTARTLDTLPDWIRFVHTEDWFHSDRYTSALAILSHTENRLYGTETMYGDWNARILLVLQDWSTSQELEDRIADASHRHHSDPWCQSPEIKTNGLLRRGFGPERTQGLLYASALAQLLKKTPKKTTAPPCIGRVLPFLGKVMKFTLGELPDQLVVICFGRRAEDVLSHSDCQIDGGFDAVRNKLIWIPGRRSDGRSLRLFASKHPSRRGHQSICELAEAARAARDFVRA